MSAKWVRSQQWDDRHLTGALAPVKVVVRLFSWIVTAVCLLSLVAIYGILASVPIGLIAKAPTVLLYAVLFVLLVGAVCVLPVWGVTHVMRRRGLGRAPCFATGIVGFIALFIAAATGWWFWIWPHLQYDTISHTGVRFFGDFIDRYQAVQFRRLPCMEMSELEFYSWWPLRVVLLLFVLNLVVATIRRIEFNFPRVGVLTVHTGIITIALGSIYYSTHKQEGDVLLLASERLDKDGRPLPGRAETGFYDNTRAALWVMQDPSVGWEMRRLFGVPRYNDYNLDVLAREEPRPAWSVSLGALDIGVATPWMPQGSSKPPVDPDISFRVVGFSSYCQLSPQWIAESSLKGRPAGLESARVREIELIANAAVGDAGAQRRTLRLLPDRPAENSVRGEMLGLEYTIGMPESRWEALSSTIPAGAQHALIVEHPASGFRNIYAVQNESSIVVGDTGYSISVKALLPRPPMPIVTKGYQGAQSSLAVVRVEGPAGADGKKAAFDRWVYSRFPEITQDMLDELNERGMPKRRDADPALKITYIDASTLQMYFDERADGTMRALVRPSGGVARVIEKIDPAQPIQAVPMLGIKLGERIEKAVRVEVPEVVPDEDRDRQRVGSREASAIAVEVRDKSGSAGVHWIPFAQYLDIQAQGGGGAPHREIQLNDGRTVSISYGRVRHTFWPEMAIRLHDFEMIPYPNSDTPKDYQSDVVVHTEWPSDSGDGSRTMRDDVQRTSLNNPLLVRTPYVAPEGMPALGRALGWVMSWIAPNQYKFAQAGWDQKGWRESEAAVARGEMKRPVARFTILGVGNNPGIYIIAAGAVMMSIGIPWAFYVKPWLVQRQKKRIQAQLAREQGAAVPRAVPGSNGTVKDHESEAEAAGTKT